MNNNEKIVKSQAISVCKEQNADINHELNSSNSLQDYGENVDSNMENENSIVHNNKLTPTSIKMSILSSSPFKLFNMMKQIKLPDPIYDANSQLIHSFPTGIFNMSHITIINLSNNKIKSIPPTINKLVSLEIFYIDRNCLTTLPIELTSLKKLAVLNVSNNPINYEKLHPFILRFMAMIAWRKKYIELKINKLKEEYTYNKLIREKEIKRLEIILEDIKTTINIKVKRSIKRMIINNPHSYLDPIAYLDSSENIELSCRLNLQRLIKIFGSELYCIARKNTKDITYYDYLNEKQVHTTLKLSKLESIQYVITFCTVLEYFFNFANNSIHKQTLYRMFNSAFKIVKSEEVNLKKTLYVITNILWFFDNNVDLF